MGCFNASGVSSQELRIEPLKPATDCHELHSDYLCLKSCSDWTVRLLEKRPPNDANQTCLSRHFSQTQSLTLFLCFLQCGSPSAPGAPGLLRRPLLPARRRERGSPREWRHHLVPRDACRPDCRGQEHRGTCKLRTTTVASASSSFAFAECFEDSRFDHSFRLSELFGVGYYSTGKSGRRPKSGSESFRRSFVRASERFRWVCRTESVQHQFSLFFPVRRSCTRLLLKQSKSFQSHFPRASEHVQYARPEKALTLLLVRRCCTRWLLTRALPRSPPRGSSTPTLTSTSRSRLTCPPSCPSRPTTTNSSAQASAAESVSGYGRFGGLLRWGFKGWICGELVVVDNVV